MRKIKRTVAFIIAISLIAVLGTSCSVQDKNVWKVSLPAHVEGAIFGGSGDDRIPVAVDFDSDWITKEDNTKYNGKLASFAALLSADSYFREKDIDRGTPNRLIFDDSDEDSYTFTTMLTQIGFTDVKHVESFKEKSYSADTNDSVTMNIGYRHVSSDYDVYVVAIRGCFSAGEWMSAFDPGADSDSYESITGVHPEWTDKKNLKGIDVAANRAYDIINEFIAAHDNSAKQTSILITGHSRGGDIAEIVGARFEDEKKIKSYTYAFNSAPIKTEESARNYLSVFNVFDSGDLLKDIMPFSEERFYRYGRTIEMNICDSSQILDEIVKLKERDDFCSAGAECISEYERLFGKLFKNRESLYEWHSFSEEFADEDTAVERFNELTEIVGQENGFGIEEYCRIHDIDRKDEGKYILTVDYCDAATLFSVSKLFTYGTSAYDAVKSLYRNNDDVCALADFLIANLKEINGGHLLVNEYVMCKHVQ